MGACARKADDEEKAAGGARVNAMSNGNGAAHPWQTCQALRENLAGLGNEALRRVALARGGRSGHTEPNARQRLRLAP